MQDLSSDSSQSHQALLPTPKSPPLQQAPVPSTPQPSLPPTQPPTHTTAPIITYPEYLITPAAPRPLITRSRLLTTLYLFSGLSALLYGTDTLLVTPMVKSLTKSRLDLAATAKANLQKLITQLEGLVSEIPNPDVVQTKAEEEDDSDEDPTEMFHRDIGIQTSLPSSPHPSRPSSPAATPASILIEQSTHLQTLKSFLSSLVEESTSEGQQTADLENTITVFREELESMAYVNPSYVFGGVGGYGASKEADDEISRVKAGIRGVKGVLLSARSFPGGVRGVR